MVGERRTSRLGFSHFYGGKEKIAYMHLIHNIRVDTHNFAEETHRWSHRARQSTMRNVGL